MRKLIYFFTMNESERVSTWPTNIIITCYAIACAIQWNRHKEKVKMKLLSLFNVKHENCCKFEIVIQLIRIWL